MSRVRKHKGVNTFERHCNIIGCDFREFTQILRLSFEHEFSFASSLSEVQRARWVVQSQECNKVDMAEEGWVEWEEEWEGWEEEWEGWVEEWVEEE